MALNAESRNLKINITGLVQGVGFRPFVFRLARQFNQTGWICNDTDGVCLVIEGLIETQQAFLHALQTQLPPFAEISCLTTVAQPLADYPDFRIIASAADGQPSPFVLPDLAPCPDCLTDLQNPDSRFFNYAFTSCCNCGPRYSIMRGLPFDRERTSMASFKPCPSCDSDYRNPENRRFHAQTIACPDCGPTLALYDLRQNLQANREEALSLAVQQLKQGKILALKAVGGFQLLVDASQHAAVARLRNRKQRPDKPFALLTENLMTARQLCKVNELAEQALSSTAAPIVILPRQTAAPIADLVAPGNTQLGIMLPASPLHFLLAKNFNGPLVATSGNLHSEPLCFENQQALVKLAEIAEVFLLHDRDVIRPLDDSVVRPIMGQNTVLRRARGYTPLPLTVEETLPPILAVGAHYKSTVAIGIGRQIICSQHLGDLDSTETQAQFEKSISDLQNFYALQPQAVCHDLHPDYHSSQYAVAKNLPAYPIAHHQAHVFACMAEHRLKPPLLGFAWDGVGLGWDQSVCGSECLLIEAQSIQRIAHFRPILLPGGDQAARQPRRSALGVLFDLYGQALPDLPLLESFAAQELDMLKHMLAKQIHCPASNSAGRLFDAVASLLGLCQINHFEGQAALLLEQAAAQSNCDDSYPFLVNPNKPAVIDWQPMLECLLNDVGKLEINDIAAKFHNTLVNIILHIAQIANQERVILSGGCFQNARLTEKSVSHLQNAGFRVYRHEKIPPNDAGIAVGQLYAAALNLTSSY